jgi:UDP-N-acetylmuramoyl-tripeptide--D-alanyl-D-alanine ligase
MTPRSVVAFAGLIGGETRGPAASTVTGVSVDSRRVRAGDAFFAIRGENADGHDYCEAALGAGAACAVVDRPLDLGGPQVIVDDVVASMGRMGKGLLAELRTPVVALTGSVGKTTARQMLAGILTRSGPVAVAPENYNTEIGVPIALTLVEPTDRFVVLEFAMRGLGQIRYLAEIAPPRVSAVLNVGTSHIELLGTREAIARAKAEILEATLPEGVCCVNRDDEYADYLLERAAAPTLTFGRSRAAEVRAEAVAADARGTDFTLHASGEALRVRIPAPGEHLVSNALCAAAMAIAAGFGDLGEIAEGLAAFEPGEHRGRVLEGAGGVLVLDDCYNAAPDSMRAALAVLAGHRAGRRVAVLGDMLELGDRSEPEHLAVGALAADSGLGLLITVGEAARAIARTVLSSAGSACGVISYADSAEAASALPALVQPGDVVLVKGSRGIRLERVVTALCGGEDR